MSVDVSRTYILPIERLADAFAAVVEISTARRGPAAHSIGLPDGSSVALPFAPLFGEPPYVLEDGEFLSFDCAISAAGGDDIEAYLRADPDPPFGFNRLKGGDIRVVAYLGLSVSAGAPCASLSFHNLRSGSDCRVLALRSVCDVLDYIARCAGGLVTYETSMGESRLLSPIEGPLPSFENRGDEQDGDDDAADDDGAAGMARIVEYVRGQEGDIP